MLGYGGAPGGGKSDLMFGLSVNKHTKTKIFRREATQLTELIGRMRELVGEDYMNLRGAGRLPGGQIIDLLGVKDEDDVNKHKGRPADMYGFDEATEFTERQIRFLTGWNRTTKLGQHCLTVLCFNPPTTVEGRWVIRYFAPWLDDKHPNPAKPGEIRYFAILPGGEEVERPNGKPFKVKNEERGILETITPRSRTFVPAKAKDNPFLDAGYESVLQNLPEPLRSQMLYGDFSAGIEDDPYQVIPTAWVKAAQKRWVDRRSTEPPEDCPRLDSVGVDVARGGRDKTTIAKRHGYWFAQLKKFLGVKTPDGPSVASLVVNEVGSSKAYINIDVIGIGSSAYDSLVANKANVNGVNNAAAATPGATDRSKKYSFVNRRAEDYWRLREALEPAKGDDLELPPDPEVLADLTAPTWKLTVRGIQVEDKREIVKRLGRSPDCGDSIVLALAPDDPNKPRDVVPWGAEQRSGWALGKSDASDY